MISEVTITIKPQDEKNQKLIQKAILAELTKKNVYVGNQDLSFVFVKKSIDARHGQVKYHLRYKVFIGEKSTDIKTSELSEWKNASGNKSVIIVGAGPAGLFGALKLLEKGIKPIIVERGSVTSKRKQDIAKISTQNLVNDDSNYCFGEGGAGTFSDGKLFTRSNKRGNINKILQIFVHFGANESILTDAHPHIGTDKLPLIINAMREKIISLGGEFYFDTRCVDFIKNEKNKVTGIVTKNTITQEQKTFTADAVVVATGHSAFDIYELIGKVNPQALEAKTFAMGVRVEHPRTLIDAIQYHGQNNDGILPTAEYRLTTQVE
nr:FAD-binding protein [Treponema sp.]